MSGALVASTNVGALTTTIFIGSSFVAGGNDTGSSPSTYSVPNYAQVGDTVLFYSLANSAGNGSLPPGSGWTNASGPLGGGNAVYVKKMAAAGDLTATISSGGGYLGFTVYRGVVSFAVVSGTGFNRSIYHAGVTFFGSAKPAPATGRLVFNSNPTPGTASDFLPPLNYVDGTNYNQYTGVEFRNQ